MKTYDELVELALEARKMAYTPYSHFKVGAALMTKDGKVYKGCNIENASYTPTNCAERTAFFKAISEGDTEFSAIAIVGGFENQKELKLCTPCGVCRQVMREFCDDDFKVILLTDQTDGVNKYQVYNLTEILPLSFGPVDMHIK
ncbi:MULTISPECIES: cytidine deaminase [unclassified Butyrivibrio]|uniref:cytidine deaminase n=1 Tax=unclassified Butyrivibrio TaxID=2639466 RepID=UPI000401C307|nr:MULTISPECIES: cytidine deaminase [unclassified Butyrivibrio]